MLVNKRTGHIEAEGIGSCNTKEKKYCTQNAYNIANTILKMAKKRALIDAVLSATRSSGVFTQDIENLDIESPQPNVPSRKPTTSSATKPNSSTMVGNITPAQKKKIQTLAQGIGMLPQDGQALLKEMFGVDNTNQLSKSQASKFIQHLLELQ